MQGEIVAPAWMPEFLWRFSYGTMGTVRAAARSVIVHLQEMVSFRMKGKEERRRHLMKSGGFRTLVRDAALGD